MVDFGLRDMLHKASAAQMEEHVIKMQTLLAQTMEQRDLYEVRGLGQRCVRQVSVCSLM